MTILKALQKINVLTKSELKHCIQRMNIEIENYKLCSKNDRPYIVKKYGEPYMKRLEAQRQKFIDRLNEN